MRGRVTVGERRLSERQACPRTAARPGPPGAGAGAADRGPAAGIGADGSSLRVALGQDRFQCFSVRRAVVAVGQSAGPVRQMRPAQAVVGSCGATRIGALRGDARLVQGTLWTTR